MSAACYFVYGPPGTGKTTFLARQCRRAVEQHGTGSVVVASLTKAAAAEIGGRDTNLPDGAVGTLHAHAYRALDRPDLAETPEGVRLWNAAHPHRALTGGGNQLEDAGAGEGMGDGGGDSVHAQVMTLRAGMVPRERWNAEQRDHDAAWTDWKRQAQRHDFTDLIETCIDQDARHHAMPRVLLVDEAQDLSRLELELVKTWSRHTGDEGTTILVGDPLQAIYSWRGADPDALEAMPRTGTRVLSQSYRVPAAVHALATTWVKPVQTGHVDYQPTGVGGAVSVSHASLRQPDTMLDLIAEKGRDGSVMVLATCGYMLNPLIRALRDAGVPFHNPYRANDGRWNPMRGAERLKAYLRADERVWGPDARCWTWDDLRRWTDPLTAKGVLMRGAKTLIEAKCQEDRFGESRAHEEVPLDTVVELLGGDMHHPALRGDTGWWAENLRAKEAGSAEYPLRVLHAQGYAALARDPRVVIGTAHSVKGGEADCVLVAPDLSNQGHAQWRAGGGGADAIRRLMYVAVTRARREVVILGPSALGGEHVARELAAAVPS